MAFFWGAGINWCDKKLQERSTDEPTALILMYSIIVVMIPNMTYMVHPPELPCSLP
jgi:hypothetical protein